jgi:hypothetical protein
MPIFPRRVIQKIITENRQFLPASQVKEHVKKLNKQDNTSIATVWEIVVLNALSKIGVVEHEKKFQGSRKPDIYFSSPDINNFVADITAISDENYDKENPINYFRECLNSFFRKEGLTTKGLCIDVGNNKIGDYGDRKIKLALPEKNDIPSFIKHEFHTIRETVKHAPNQAFKKEIKKGEASLTVTYNPHSNYSTGGYASFTVPYSLTKNPLYNRLKKKADQLRSSKYDGIMGVFVCDGKCDSLNNDFYCVEKYSQADIIQEVFRVNNSLSFVIVFTPEEQSHMWGLRSTKFIKGQFYSNPAAKYPTNQDFFENLKKVEKHLPVPESMPINAITFMKSQKNKGLSHYGGFTMSQNEIKISSRMITELLAGVLKFEKFDSEHKQMSNDNRNMIKEFFLTQLGQGRMIEKISIEKCQDEDDDWIKLTYGASDAAISKYK